MEDGIASVRKPVEGRGLADVALARDDTRWPLAYVVFRVARHEHHFMAAPKKLGDRPGSHDTCPACHKYFHATCKSR